MQTIAEKMTPSRGAHRVYSCLSALVYGPKCEPLCRNATQNVNRCAEKGLGISIGAQSVNRCAEMRRKTCTVAQKRDQDLRLTCLSALVYSLLELL